MPTVRYLVDDVASAVSFYVDQFGFVEKERYGPAMAIVERDGLTLWLARPAAPAAQPLPEGRKPAPARWNRLVIGGADLGAAAEPVRADGATLRNDPVR